MAVPLLEVELERLRNSVSHLERSNRELKEAMIEEGRGAAAAAAAAEGGDGPDAEFKTAIAENIVTIAKQRARIASLEEELEKATGGGAPCATAPALERPRSVAGVAGRQAAEEAGAEAEADAMQLESEGLGVTTVAAAAGGGAGSAAGAAGGDVAAGTTAPAAAVGTTPSPAGGGVDDDGRGGVWL